MDTYEWFVRITQCPKGEKALEYLKEKSLSIFCVYEDKEVKNGETVKPHWHLYLKTRIKDKEIRKQVNERGVKKNEMWSLKAWEEDFGDDAFLYMCKGASENESPVIVHNNVKTDEEVALLHSTFWKNREEFRRNKKRKASAVSWSQQTIKEIVEQFENKIGYEKIDVVSSLLRRFRDTHRPWNRRLQQQMFETIWVNLEGASEEHLEFTGRNIIQNMYDTRT